MSRRRSPHHPPPRGHTQPSAQRSFVHTLLAALLATAMAGCDRPPAQPAAADDRPTPVVTIAAAASLTGVLNELAPLADKQTGVRIAVNAAGSGTLAQQILQGAPADLFISANTRWMDELQRKGLTDRDSRVNLVRNRLVLIAGTGVVDAPGSLAQLPAYPGRIAIGDPESVPAGRYARQSLVAAGVWDQLQDRVLPAVDVRAALAYVQSRAAPLGIVYATDTASATNIRVVLRIPGKLHSPIVYPAAVLRDATDPDTADRLLGFLRGASAQRIFKRAGFEPMQTTHAPHAPNGEG